MIVRTWLVGVHFEVEVFNFSYHSLLQQKKIMNV